MLVFKPFLKCAVPFQNGQIYRNWTEPDLAPLNFDTISKLCDPILASSMLAGIPCTDHFPELPMRVGDKDDRINSILGDFDIFKK
jgi:hypothetical protein